jgi:multicomponent K+:H+ antiporter subunit E/multicomponent Na+:H+ antiporter subunit E
MMVRVCISVVLLTLVYLMTLGSRDIWDVAGGAVLSSGLLLVHWRFIFGCSPAPRLSLLKRTRGLVKLVGAVLLDIARGTWRMALFVLHIRPLKSPGIVEVPIVGRSASGVVVSALVTTLSPGSVLVDIDWRRRVMLFHVFDATDPQAVGLAEHDSYLRYQQHVFP